MHSSFIIRKIRKIRAFAIGQVINVDITLLPHVVLLTSWTQDYRKSDIAIQGISQSFSYQTPPKGLLLATYRKVLVGHF